MKDEAQPRSRKRILLGGAVLLFLLLALIPIRQIWKDRKLQALVGDSGRVDYTTTLPDFAKDHAPGFLHDWFRAPTAIRLEPRSTTLPAPLPLKWQGETELEVFLLRFPSLPEKNLGPLDFRGNHQLKSLDLVSYPCPDPPLLHCPELAGLTLTNLPLENPPDLRGAPNLKVIDLSKTPLPDLSPCTALEQVRLRFFDGPWPDFSRSPSLISLNVTGSGLKAPDLTGLKKLKALRLAEGIDGTLDLSPCPALTAVDLGPDFSELPDFSHSPRLRNITFYGQSLTSFKNLSTAKEVENLVIIYGNFPSDFDFTNLPRLKNLRLHYCTFASPPKVSSKLDSLGFYSVKGLSKADAQAYGVKSTNYLAAPSP